eukprot:TRINITY_DN4440_c0_g1_i1.p1 TRINITY_DN4440_c0_g1~~TRINITY_DN4440_c0_g1_i1.p1  ORF type:complete len:207 (-),score=54.71 TRINITY_DN4440_c0_g1_i1:205-825(-)
MAFHGPVYGLDAELAEKRAATYDVNLENEIREWMKSVTGEPVVGDFHAALKSGVTLCNLVNKLRPGVVKNIGRGAMPFVQMENINAYLSACKTLGVPENDLFMTINLFEAKDMKSVLQNLATLKRVATGKVAGGSSSAPQPFGGGSYSGGSSGPSKSVTPTPPPAKTAPPPKPSPPSGAPSANFCSGCGTKAPAGAKFCSGCGTKL